MKRINEFLGGSLQGYFDTIPSLLVDKLGKPDTSDEYKVSGEYTLETSTGIKFYLYDWKATSLYDSDYPEPSDFWSSDSIKSLHIGGSNLSKDDINQIKKELNEVLSEK